MEYNKNFNKCEMAKYLIINAKNYVTNGTKIKIGEFISEFQYPDFNTVLDVDRFITFNERFDVTINGITYKEILPYYVMFIEKTNGFPVMVFMMHLRHKTVKFITKLHQAINQIN